MKKYYVNGLFYLCLIVMLFCSGVFVYFINNNVARIIGIIICSVAFSLLILELVLVIIRMKKGE